MIDASNIEVGRHITDGMGRYEICKVDEHPNAGRGERVLRWCVLIDVMTQAVRAVPLARVKRDFRLAPMGPWELTS